MPILVSVIVIVLIIAPYVFALSVNTNEFIFGGFLINPIDGHSYLAKMHQGFRGEWRFVLPYTAEPGNGAYLFLFYLGIGHLARIIGLPIIVVFHSFRILGAILLLVVLYIFNSRVFDNKRLQNIGFAVSAFGSGLGWAAVFAGLFTSDFWVAEAFPFLSMYTNPHFSIGLALMILALLPDRKSSILVDFMLGLGLGIIQPFAVVIVILVKGGGQILSVFNEDNSGNSFIKSAEFLPVIAFSLGGGAVLIYQYWSIVTDPVLSMWNSQNITESPSVIDLAISLSPALIFAASGIKAAWADRKGRNLLIWAAVSLILVLVPWNLQRRFLTGIYVPLAGLSVYGLVELDRFKWLSFKAGVIFLLVTAIPTNILVLSSGIQAAARRDPQIYLEKEILSGLNWVKDNSSEGAMVLADEDVGLFIPSISGRRVVYGHPFETVNAEFERDFLNEFLYINQENHFYEQSILDRKVDLIFLKGDVSESLEIWINNEGFKLDYENSKLKIFRVEQ